jgi:cytochrome c/quinol oxidase subunit I
MFVPHCIAVPRGRRVTLRFATPDVVHGLLITGTNVNTMVVPGFIAQVYTEFTQAADLLMPCRDVGLRRVRRPHQYGLRHEREGAQHVVDYRALSSDFRRLRRHMHFAIAYEIWPRLTGRAHASTVPLRLQLWLWFIGMMVMTLPWHWLGLQGQWRRVANFNYADPIIAGWGPLVIVSLAGGLVLLTSALLFARNLAVLPRSPFPALRGPLYALAVEPPQRVPVALNGFGLWNLLVLFLMLVAYGYPIAQFAIAPSPAAMVHRMY